MSKGGLEPLRDCSHQTNEAREIPINGDLNELFISFKTQHIKGYIFCEVDGNRYTVYCAGFDNPHTMVPWEMVNNHGWQVVGESDFGNEVGSYR